MRANPKTWPSQVVHDTMKPVLLGPGDPPVAILQHTLLNMAYFWQLKAIILSGWDLERKGISQQKSKARDEGWEWVEPVVPMKGSKFVTRMDPVQFRGRSGTQGDEDGLKKAYGEVHAQIE